MSKSDFSSSLLSGYMTPRELARELDKSLITLARWRHRKIGPPFIKAGKQVLYSRDAARRWLERLETKPQF